MFILLQLLQRLLADRQRSMDTMMLEGPQLAEARQGEEGEQAKVKLSTLKQKWGSLQLEAEQRSATSTVTLILGQCMTYIYFTNDENFL